MRGKAPGLLALLLALAACEREHVKVTVEPKADGTFVRTVRLWREDSEKPGIVLPPSEAARAAAIAVYGAPPESSGDEAAVTFRGTFRAVPPDLAPAETPNRGAFDAVRCAAGWCGIYRERRPGPTDFHGRFEAAAGAIDFGARLQAEIARKALAGDEALPAVLARLEGPWRRDMRDLLFLLMTSARADPGPGANFHLEGFEGLPGGALAMALELLEERGYVQIPEFVALGDAQSEDGQALFLRAYAGGLLGRPVTGALREKLAPLATEEGLGAAVEEALRAMGATEEEAGEAIEPLAFALRHLDRGTVPTFTVEILLPPGADGVETTGKVEGGCVRFEDELGDSLVRDVLLTSFAVADEAWQRERFGRVLLVGATLRRYALWLASLPAEEAAAFEVAVSALTPGPGLPDRIRALGGLSAPGARLLLSALE
jgi:hypothetical protein